jgi:hypothetical protein
MCWLACQACIVQVGALSGFSHRGEVVDCGIVVCSYDAVSLFDFDVKLSLSLYLYRGWNAKYPAKHNENRTSCSCVSHKCLPVRKGRCKLVEISRTSRA